MRAPPEGRIITNPSSEITYQYLMPLVGGLRGTADDAVPDWQSLFLIVQAQDEGIVTIDDLTTPRGRVSMWLGPARAHVVDLCADWLGQLHAAHTTAWHSMAVGAERESGAFDAFFVSPGADTTGWHLSPQTVHTVSARAWQQLNIQPKPE